MDQKNRFPETFEKIYKNRFLGIMVGSDFGFDDSRGCPMIRRITRDPSRPPKPPDSLSKIIFPLPPQKKHKKMSEFRLEA